MRRMRDFQSTVATIMATVLMITTFFSPVSIVLAEESGNLTEESTVQQGNQTGATKENIQQANKSFHHDAPTELSSAEDFRVEVTTEATEEVTLYYKPTSISEPITAPMKQEQVGQFIATIPKVDLWSAELEYWFESTEEKSDVYSVSLEKQKQAQSEQAPKLVITEATFSNEDGSFIEVYNNTTQPLNLDAYQLLVQDQEFSFPEGTTIPSGKTEVLWIADNGKDVNEFIKQYDTKLSQDQVTAMEGSVTPSPSDITFIHIPTKTTEVMANYAPPKTAASELFYYKDTMQMQRGGFATTATPGSLIQGQVPSELVTVKPASENDSESAPPEDTDQTGEATESPNQEEQKTDPQKTKENAATFSIQHEAMNQMNGDEDVRLEAMVPNASEVVLAYQTGEKMEMQELPFTEKSNTDKYEIELPSTTFWSPLFYYQIRATDATGKEISFPENELNEVDVNFSGKSDTQSMPNIMITEITPDSDNINGKDAYEFIEIYNNTNQPINMKDYKILYRYPDGKTDQQWDITEDKVIGSQESFIAWIHNGENNHLGIDEFNATYGLTLTDNQVTALHNHGMANGSERTLVIADDFNNEISSASYNTDSGIDDTKANQGITYAYPIKGSEMRKVGVSKSITPLEIISGQVPKEAVEINTEAAAPNVGKPKFHVSDDRIEIEVPVNSKQELLGVNLYVSQSEPLGFQSFSMKAIKQDKTRYSTSIPREALWNEEITYYVIASNSSGETQTKEDVYTLPHKEVDFQSVPPLLITEIVPDTANAGGADAYEFIEVYNNTSETIDFQDYTIRYRYPNTGAANDLVWGPAHDETVHIPSGETAVFWVINSGNQEKTGKDFNANFGSSVTEGSSLFKMYNSGMANGSERTIVIATKSGREIASATYNDQTGVDDTLPDKGIVYRYPTDGTKHSKKISAGKLAATPGTVSNVQVPTEKVNLPADSEKPFIEDLTNKTSISSESTASIEATMTDNQEVKSATLYYRTTEDSDFRRVNLERQPENRYQHIIYEPELIGKDNLEYYFVASDGKNETVTETVQVPIEHPNMQTGLRLNVLENELLSGEKVIKATDDTYTENMNLFIDDAPVTDTFKAMENEAYFAFDVSETNIYFKNGVTMDDEILEIFDETYNDFITLTVPISADKLQPGENTISIRSGNKVSPFDETSTENRDDFTIKNVRLVLSDGTVVYDPAYANPERSYPVGDSAGKKTYDFTFALDEKKFSSHAYLFDTTAIEDGTHEVKATLGERETVANVITDNTKPVIKPSVKNDQEYKGAFTIDARVEDANDITEVSAQLDGEYISMPYETSSSLLAADEHTLSISATDSAGNTGMKEVTFQVVEEHPWLPDWMENDADATSANLSVSVADPTNDKLNVEFYQSYQYTADDTKNMRLSHNAVGTEPPKGYLPKGETKFTKEERKQIEEANGQAVSTTSFDKFPYHRFNVTVDQHVDENDEIEIVWDGSSLEGRKVTMYAWNYTDEEWQELTSTIAGKEAFQLVGSVTGKDFLNDQKVSVIVQDQIANAGEDFTFVWTSDTQYYSESYPHIYENQVDWIAKNQDRFNIEYVFHTGDLVNIYDDFAQWDVADRSMKVLDDAGVPYGVLAGNHDVDQKDNNYTNYYTYFGDQRFKDRDHFGGSYKNNRGHYDLISVNGNDFIMVYMGWGVDQEGIDWINEVLKEHPNRKAILSFHEYLLASGSRSPIGDELFEKVVVPNKNVMAVLSGHYHNSQKLLDDIDDDGDGEADRTVYQLLADYQGGPEGGQGYLRLLNFNMETNAIDVQTYSPYKDDYNFYEPSEFPGKDEFTLDWDLTAQEKKVATDYIEVNVYTDELIGKVKNVPSGEIASVNWKDLQPESEYFWYVNTTDAYGGNTRSDVWGFLTADGEVVDPEIPEVPGDGGDGSDGDGGSDGDENDSDGGNGDGSGSSGGNGNNSNGSDNGGKPVELPNNQQLTVTPVIKNGKVIIDEDFTSIDKSGNLVINLKGLDKDKIALELSPAQTDILKAKQIVLTLVKEDIKLDIPSSALKHKGAVEISLEQREPVQDAVSNVYDISIIQAGQHIDTFKENLTLTLDVDTKKVTNPEHVNTYYYNEKKKEWEPAEGEYADGKAIASLSHLSTYAAFEKQQSNSMNQDSDQQQISSVSNDSGKKGADVANGFKLPDTATNLYNYLLAGLVLLIAGASIWLIASYRKKID